MVNKSKVTIKEIAQMAGTSKTTVSFYLNGKNGKMSKKTKDRIEKAIEETGYQPSIVARSLNSKNSKLLGVVIGDITNTFSNQIVKGIEDVASKKGYQIIVGNSNYDFNREEVYIDRMLSMGVDGFIVQPTSQFRKQTNKLKDAKKSLVFFDSEIYDLKTSWVKTNNYDATYDATKECINKGYDNYILITADTSLLSTRMERAKGFIDALTDHDLELDKLVIDDYKTDYKVIHDFIKKHININEKNLIFVPNCWALPEVFMVLKNNYSDSLDNIGLLGFDNTEWTNFSSPTVSTIVQPAYEEGQQAAAILIDQIEENNDVPHQQVLNCHVNWNESTK
ncbi:LacI family DNA-binding transcriptional regulator [Breznakia pachnodae]|uniref:DNA-binding LacI/PurR family transcriptional regulator n=1 Tax=Breznakia pachnodae TaxID=265178 RepID=A0ABU0E181_9FIRM|nr:LacI family DNA-binding transcriptional regulator [Breznakia pachnodae]MDQ0360544.1 DNA-binding LacI/PurR family transcriptional regulator [Breznakia pachnodae]